MLVYRPSKLEIDNALLLFRLSIPGSIYSSPPLKLLECFIRTNPDNPLAMFLRVPILASMLDRAILARGTFQRQLGYYNVVFELVFR